MTLIDAYIAALPAVGRVWLDVLVVGILATGFAQAAFHLLQLPAAWRQMRHWSRAHDERASWVR